MPRSHKALAQLQEQVQSATIRSRVLLDQTARKITRAHLMIAEME
jgi:hypothetical protein